MPEEGQQMWARNICVSCKEYLKRCWRVQAGTKEVEIIVDRCWIQVWTLPKPHPPIPGWGDGNISFQSPSFSVPLSRPHDGRTNGTLTVSWETLPAKPSTICHISQDQFHSADGIGSCPGWQLLSKYLWYRGWESQREIGLSGYPLGLRIRWIIHIGCNQNHYKPMGWQIEAFHIYWRKTTLINKES